LHAGAAGNVRVSHVFRAFRVSGRVQGVYFRQSTRLEAERLQVRGTARNLEDGSVEVLAAGDAAAVEALRAFLHRGPAAARVDAVEERAVDEAQRARLPAGFEVG
jgi:acylphosphatase